MGYNEKNVIPPFFLLGGRSLVPHFLPGVTSAPDGFLNQCAQGCPDVILLVALILAPFVFLAMTAIGWFSLEENLQVEGAKITPSVCFFAIGAVGTVATVATYFLLFMNAVHATQGIIGGTS